MRSAMSTTARARAICAVAVALGLIISSSGCATIANRKQKTIFLHMSEDVARTTRFELDGKPAAWQMRAYSSREVSRTSTTVTIETRYLPALLVSSPGRYVTLAATFADGRREEILLKRDLMRGYKLFIYLNWMTMGVGTLVDVFGEGLFGMEEVTVLGPAPVATRTVRHTEVLR